jgi:hypothetical protein
MKPTIAATAAEVLAAAIHLERRRHLLIIFSPPRPLPSPR